MPHGDADGIDEERVDPHAGCKGEGLLGDEGHRQCAENGSEGSGREDGAVGLRHLSAQHIEDIRVHGQDIGHRQKGRQARQYLRPDAMLFGVKPQPFQEFHSSLFRRLQQRHNPQFIAQPLVS